MKRELEIRFKHNLVQYLAHCLTVTVVAVVFIGFSPTQAQSATDFNQLPDEAFETGLIIDVYALPQGGFRYAVASRSEPEYIHILDSDFEQIAYFSPTQSQEVAAEHSYRFLDLKWSPDGNWLAATVDVVIGGYLQIWNTNTGVLVSTTQGFFNGVTAWSPDNDQVAVSEEDKVLVIDAANGQISHQFLLPVYRQAFRLGWDAHGERLAARNGQGIVNVWSVDSETLAFEINTANAELVPSEIAEQNLPFSALFAWDPSGGNQIALYDATSLNIEIWDIALQELVASFPTDIDNLRELHWARLGLVLYDTFPRGEPGSIQVLSPLDGSILQEAIFQQQNEYIVTYLNLDDPEAFEIVVGEAPLSRALSEVLSVETISITLLPTATPIATNTQIPPTDTPVPTALITNVTVANGKTYVQDTMALGTMLYIDRTYNFTSIPDEFLGQEFIRTANDDKALTTSNFLTFTLTQDAAVYLLYDSRFPAPSWLSSWIDTQLTIVATEFNNTQLARRLYLKYFPAGSVTLDANNLPSTSVMYNVMAVPDTGGEHTLYRINSGGTQVSTNAITYALDAYVTGGKGNTLASGDIANTTEDVLYYTEHSADIQNNSLSFTYDFPVPNGTYGVRLHFAELWWTGASGSRPSGTGRRVFDVQIEGVTVLDDYDITASAGAPLTADVKTFTNVMVNDGSLTIYFPPASVDHPSISAIEVFVAP